MAEITGKIVAKKSDNKALKLSDDNWYNMNSGVVDILKNLSKGDEVVLTYEQKNTSRNVSAIRKPGVATTTNTNYSTGFTCEVCGKELKDGKFKKCYMCNKSGAQKPNTATTNPEEKTGKSSQQENIKYGSPEDTAGKQRGCALGAAATVASSQQFNDPEVAKQFTLILAEEFLTWLRTE